MRIKTIADLKKHLADILEELENYDDDEEVKTETNTYWVGDHFLALSSGFIDLDNPTGKSQEDDNDDEW